MLWHFAIHPVARYMWAAPEAVYLDLWRSLDAETAESQRANAEKIRELNAKLETSRASIEGLQRQMGDLQSAQQFKINIDTGGYYIAINDKPEYPRTKPEIWLVYHGVVITNETEKQLPLELRMRAGMRADDAYRISWPCRSTLPDWIDKRSLEDEKPFDRLLNLPPLAAVSGFCATDLPYDIFHTADVVGAKEFAETRPFWLEVKNKLTDESDESKSHAMNYIARNIDRSGGRDGPAV
jgi:hypothetical protein